MTTKQLDPAVQALLSKAKARLVVSHPFFASILLKRPIITDEARVPTMAVDARARIYVNPEFIRQYSVEQVMWGLCHECMHVMLMHFVRTGGRNPRKANIAQDACINDILNDTKVGQPIPNCVNTQGGQIQFPGAKDMTWEEVYDKLPDDPDGGNMGDDVLDWEDLTDAEREAVKGQIRREIAEAAQAARMRGKLPGGLERIIDEILYVKTPWHVILERFLTERAKADYSWAHPNRRHIANGLYLPSLDSQSSMGHVVVIVDTSGSTSGDLAAFNGHFNRIRELCRPEKTTVISVDAAVQHVEEYGPDEGIQPLNCTGGGGTDLTKGFDYIAEQGLEPVVCVVLTDAQTPWPDGAPDYPVIVLSTTDDVGPDWAETVRFENDE